jgi:hypothetical protein
MITAAFINAQCTKLHMLFDKLRCQPSWPGLLLPLQAMLLIPSAVAVAYVPLLLRYRLAKNS